MEIDPLHLAEGGLNRDDSSSQVGVARKKRDHHDTALEGILNDPSENK